MKDTTVIIMKIFEEITIIENSCGTVYSILYFADRIQN